jgi:ESCRT-II complex subunit VPS36
MKQITSVDGTIPLQALLWKDEQHLTSQPAVGLYWGALKAPRHQNGTVHLTSHRLIYLDAQHPARNSLAILLSSVNETEHYSGFITSSPKLTLFFRKEDAGPLNASLSGSDEQDWTCQVCDEKNLGGDKCKLCGVPKDAIESEPQSLASSLPSRTSILRSVSPSVQEVACTACTFLNSTSLKTCEICGSPLPTLQTKTSKSAPISRASSPGMSALDDPNELNISAFKISFRKGGDKAFYTLLKRSLKSKAWVVCSLCSRPPHSSYYL